MNQVTMKFILLIIAAFHLAPSYGQNFITKEGEYMDTSTAINGPCGVNVARYVFGDTGPIYYYSTGGKYPKSSTSLLKEAKTFIAKKNNSYFGSGYITFRFIIDCEGHMTKKVRVFQTDENYTNTHFDKMLVNELFDYVKTLDKWKKAGDKTGPAFNYMAFITFKIRNGKVINIIP